MRAIRVAWLAMAVAALGYAVACGFMPVGEVTVSCGKSGELSVAGAHAGATCEDSIFAALGPRRLVEMGVLLVVAPLIAAVALRVWVSWLVVPAMAVLVFVGVANWADFWLLLSFGALVLLVASIVVATAHLAVRARRDSHHARGVEAASFQNLTGLNCSDRPN